MTNPNTPFGLRPYRRLDGTTGNFMTNAGQIAYNNAHTFGEGDMLIPLSTGYVDAASTQSNPIQGVFAWCFYPNPANTIQVQNQRAWTAPTLGSTVVVNAYYWDDPNLVFAVRANGSVTQANMGLNAKFTSNAAPSSLTGISTLALDTTTISTNSTYPLRIIEYEPVQGNDTTSAYCVVGVTLNTQVYKTPTGV